MSPVQCADIFVINAFNGKVNLLEAISKLIERQSKTRRTFLLFISCNLDIIDHHEVRFTLQHVETELNRNGKSGTETISAYLQHEMEEARLKLYVPYYVRAEGAKHHYSTKTYPVIFYAGNRGVKMMAFRILLRFNGQTLSARIPQERLSQIVNTPLVHIQNGKPATVTLGLPKVRSKK